MSRSIPFRAGRPIVGLASLLVVAASLVAIGAVPVGAESSAAVSACPSGPPVLEVGNPNPGDVISQGDYIISGVAFDPAATDGSGIARVDLFLGSRDNGGVFLVSATPGEGSTSARAFEVKATVPSTANGARDFVAYAYSALDGQVTTVTVPVYVGAAPTPTPSSNTAPKPSPLAETITSTCAAISPVAASAPAFQPLPATGAQATPVLSLANPSAADLLPTGDVIVQGIAYDPGAGQGSGIDRIDLFLDNRDNGGTVLGTGTSGGDHRFTIKATLPSSANGGHTLYAYAHSSITDRETVVSVPVFVGVAPTPTPRPAN